MKKINSRTKRLLRNRSKLKKVNVDRYRIAVFKSLKNISAQIIDDKANKTIVSASSMEKDLKKYKKDDGKPKSKPKPEEETLEGEEHEYDKFYREEKERRKNDRQNGNRPLGRPNGGFKPPWKK